MWKYLRPLLLFVGIVGISLPLSAKEEGKDGAKDKPVIAVNPVGKPAGLAKGNAIRYFLWYDSEGWHLRSDSGGKKHLFSGNIAIAEGKVTAVTNFGNLEPGKKKKVSDLGHVNEAKNQIDFKFTTSKKRDGFDFQVDESAKEIHFKLLIDGKPTPERILIGPRSQPSPSAALSLPAHPPDEPPKNSGKTLK